MVQIPFNIIRSQLDKKMGRTKKKQSKDRVCGTSDESDSDVSDRVHERFLENVKQFQGKPKYVTDRQKFAPNLNIPLLSNASSPRHFILNRTTKYYRIKPPTRRETAAEVSEFNLPSTKKVGKKKVTFREDDLMHALRKKKPQIAQKLQAAKKTKTLSKPLDTVYEKKVRNTFFFSV